MILIFFLVDLCKLLCKTRKKKLSVLRTTLCPALGNGTGVSLGSKIISASWGLTWAAKEDAVLPQTAVIPSCYWGTENRFPPWAGPCIPTEMVYVCVCPSVPPYRVLNLLATFGWTWRRRGLQSCSALLTWVKDTSTCGFLLGFMDVNCYWRSC